jgi:hypothetical protein
MGGKEGGVLTLFEKPMRVREKALVSGERHSFISHNVKGDTV